MSDVQLSVVLPCYNEAGNLPLLLDGYRQVWPHWPAELVLVNNGSTDDSAAVLAGELARPEYAFARVVTVERNQGYGHGLFTGLHAARGQLLACSHADMQCAPTDVFRACELLVSQPNAMQVLVKGQRGWRGLGAALITNGMALIASGVLGMRLTDINAQPKVFHRDLLSKLIDPPAGFQFDLYLLYRAKQSGWSIQTIPVVFGKRAHGESKWAFSRLSRWRTIWATIRYIFQLRLG